jgi:5'-3' exonuclease
MKDLFELDALTNTPVFETPENLMLVDCLNLAFRFKHRGQTEFSAEFLRTISSLAKSYSAKQVVLLADHGHSSYRREVYPEYKAGRADKYKDQTEEEKQKVKEFFDGYERALELCATVYPLVRMKNVEADDLGAYIVKNHSFKFKNVWLISSDADWDLLLKHNVHRFSFVTRVEYTLGNFYETKGCDNPEQYVSIKALQGDSGDSVPGIPLVGVKRAYALTKQYGSAIDLYDSLPLPGNQKVTQNINNSGNLIVTNYELMDLLSYCETAINHPDKSNLETLENICIEYFGE